MKKLVFIVVFLNLFLNHIIWAQPADQALYHFKFFIKNRSDIDQITKIISIDNISNDTVYAYANENEFNRFKKLNITFELIPETKADKAVAMAATLSEMSGWNKYPTYEVYLEMMQNWVTQYPSLCALEEIGTLQSGRKLLALKISDNPTYFSENEPKIYLSSTIHGDEIAGYGILLHLIDYLLTSYNPNNTDKITQLINNSEIWITPLANPDGAYKGGNASLSAAIRYNGNYIDLNRNFPDPAAGENPDGNVYQQETQFMMDFAAKHKFSLGVNIHGGVEVVNYPWDTWSKRSPDNNWWKYVGGNYRDSAQKNSTSGYLTSVSNGLTDGYDWYRITGGRQDYMNYYQRCREFTLEISIAKLYPAGDLPKLWNYNRAALVGYISEALQGIHGNIINDKGLPVLAKIEVVNYDKDNSEVFSDSINGFFTRYLKAGTYKLKISATGYSDGIIEKINVMDGQQTYIKHILIPVYSKICIDSSHITRESLSKVSDSIIIPLINCGNQLELISAHIENMESKSWISIKNSSLTVTPKQERYLVLNFNNSISNDTALSCNLFINGSTSIKIPITVNFKSQHILQVNRAEINHTLTTNTLLIDSLVLENLDTKLQQINIVKPKVSWLIIPSDSIYINALHSKNLVYKINCSGLAGGLYSTMLEYNNGTLHTIPIKIIVETKPIIETQNYQENILINKNEIFSTAFLLSNKGGGELSYTLKISDQYLQSKIEINPTSGLIAKSGVQTIALKIYSKNINLGKYSSIVEILSKYDTLKLPLNITIDTLPLLYVNTDTLKIQSTGFGIYRDSILVENIGGGQLDIVAKEKITQGYSLVTLPTHINAVPGKSSTFINFIINATNLTPKDYYSTLSLNNKLIPIIFTLNDKAKITMNKSSINHSLEINGITTDTIVLTNIGSNTLDFFVENNTQSMWFNTNTASGEIEPGKSFPLIISINTKGLIPNEYYGKLILKSSTLTRIPVTIKVLPSR